jgi:hypothetical protein
VYLGIVIRSLLHTSGWTGRGDGNGRGLGRCNDLSGRASFMSFSFLYLTYPCVILNMCGFCSPRWYELLAKLELGAI